MSTETEIKTEPKEESKSEESKAIEFNSRAIDRTIQVFTKENLEPPHGILFEKEQLEKFKSKFKPDKGPLQIIINTLNRRQVLTYDEKGKAVKKDYLTYNVDFHGKDWLGNDMWIRGHIEGKSIKPKFKTTFQLEPETGNNNSKKEYDGIEDEYYIELTDNKKQIQDIINNCNGTIIDRIKFYGHFEDSIKGPSMRCDQFSYDQLLNSSFEELEALARKEGGPQGNAPSYKNKDNKGYHG